MKILVTGFDAFGGEMINPSIEVVKKLPNKILDADIIKLEIKTVAFKSLEQIREAIIKEKPDVVLSIGQAGGSSDISVEKVGINLNDFRIKDNEGNQIIDEPIFEDGPTAYFSNLPVKAMVKKIREEKIPASVSCSAGTFVCNHVLYGCLYMAEREFKGLRAGFVHIPFLPEQVVDKKNVPSMSMDSLVKGLVALIEAIVENTEDIHTVGGEIY